MFITSVAITTAFYIISAYITFVAAGILYVGISCRLLLPMVKSSLFIIGTYISIISDVIFFNNSLYSSISVKNGLLLLLMVASLISAESRKESSNEHS